MFNTCCNNVLAVDHFRRKWTKNEPHAAHGWWFIGLGSDLLLLVSRFPSFLFGHELPSVSWLVNQVALISVLVTGVWCGPHCFFLPGGKNRNHRWCTTVGRIQGRSLKIEFLWKSDRHASGGEFWTIYLLMQLLLTIYKNNHLNFLN